MKKKTTTKYLFVHIVLIAGTLLTVFPFLWMIFTSFKGIGETMRIPPTILPESLKLDGYKGVLEALPFARVYLNTIIVTVITVLGQILFCSMAAFAFARLRFRGKNLIFIIILSVLMVPSQIFIMPQYLIMQKLGVLDSLPALFIQNLCSAFTVFLLRQFFMSLPKELEEAAIVDGCGFFRIYAQIMLPLIKPGIVAVVIFTGKSAWNSFMWPMIANTSPDKMILAPALATLQGQFTTNYPMQMSGAVMSVVPVIVMFFIFQKQFIEGVAHTGVKG
ncbi:MAG: carbohydrate ABC transporter permease [Lachnospiraceae bacterium]|uniref:carbohydrate ABC transporter permease n=1 Tax=Faecalimonas umbilicata TaxID=1912855 RepID=UPI0002082CD3|nr:carbohydrate ABC transporter permease [Faecalimonas umbilicata]EGG90433.1 hypothetical protein HMPREF0987_00308 [Lachnospiraceae bacterium 9_1_43BFAA]MBS4980363.1 carbohydrate ABC transporter permease [Lachnospiraceae bacterium]